MFHRIANASREARGPRGAHRRERAHLVGLRRRFRYQFRVGSATEVSASCGRSLRGRDWIGRRFGDRGRGITTPPDAIALAATLLLAWCFQWFLTNAAFLRWRAARTLRALLCAVGLGSRVDRDDVSAPPRTPRTPTTSQRWRTWRPSAYCPPRAASPRLRPRPRHSSPRRHESDDNRLGQLPAGLTNSGNTCFAASALQCLYHTRLFTAHFSDGPHDSCDARGFCVTCEYQAHVKRALDAEPKASFSIGRLTSAIGKIAKHFVRGRQEDSHEYISGLLDAMHTQWLKEAGGGRGEDPGPSHAGDHDGVPRVRRVRMRSRGVFRVRTREPHVSEHD